MFPSAAVGAFRGTVPVVDSAVPTEKRLTFWAPKSAIASLDGRTSAAAMPFSNFLRAADEATLTASPSVQQKSSVSPPKLPPGATMDEVSNLIGKFYVDRTFHHQDWKAVSEKYRLQIRSTTSPQDELKLATRMVQTLGDKFTRVIDPEAYAQIQKYDLIGIGVVLMPDETGRIKVGAPPLPDSPADRAGIRDGDLVTFVNGRSTQGRTAFDIIDQLMEEPNAESLTMTLRTETPDNVKGEGLTRTVTVPRQFSQVKDPVRARITERRSDGTVVAYVRISEFNALVKQRLEQVLTELEQTEGANAYVLDVRSNPGGAFQSAVNIASLFLDNRVATQVVDSNAVEIPFRTTTGHVLVDASHPVVLWMDGQSASATEVLAGALHDNCRAVIMGDPSFGKGLIQAVYGLKSGAGLVLTVARYVTPGGIDIQGSGITPDLSSKEGGVASSFLPMSLMDTSKVNFRDVTHRLEPPLCQPAKDTSSANAPKEASVPQSSPPSAAGEASTT